MARPPRPAPGAVVEVPPVATELGGRFRSAERISDELSKLLLGPRPGRGLQIVVDSGLAEGFLPELSALRLEQDPVHRHKDVLAHTLAVIERCEPNLVLRLAALQDDVEERIARLAEEENLDAMRPPLDGNEVMEHLGIAPGPIVGEALEHLMQLRLDRGPIEHEEALALLDAWAADRGIGGEPRP